MIDVQDIGIDEMVSSPRSDLTSPDFFLWNNIKNIVYEKIIPTPEDLKTSHKSSIPKYSN